MKKMKKLLCLLVVACFALTMVLAACGDDSDDDDAAVAESTAPASPDASGTVAPPANGPDISKEVALKWYFVGNNPQKDEAAIEAEANKYLKDKINATIDLNCFDWGSYDQKVSLKIASGEEFDMNFTSNWTVNYGQNAARGAYVDLIPLLDQYAPKTKEVLGQDVIKGASIDGKLFAIPTNKEMAHNWIFMYREDTAKELGLDLSGVKKMEDLEPIFKIVKEKKPGMYPYQSIKGESIYRVLDFEKIIDDDCPGAIYGDYRDTTVVQDFSTPEAKALWNLVKKWQDAGYLRKDANTIQDQAADPKAGKVFGLLQSGKPGKDVEMTNSWGQDFAQIEMTAPVKTTREMTGSMQAISKTSKNPERALMFLEMMNNDKFLNNLINFGIEGKHYKKVNDTQIDKGPEVDNYNPGTPWMFANQFMNYVYTNEAPDKWAQFKAFNDSAKPCPILGFCFNAEPVKTEVANLKAAKREYVTLLETGKVSSVDDTISKMESKFKAAGLEKVLAEMQAQVDKFLGK